MLLILDTMRQVRRTIITRETGTNPALVTDINIVVDSLVQPYSNLTIHIGGKQFDAYLLTLLQQDSNVVEQCQKAGVNLDESFARCIREGRDVCHISVGHELQPTAESTEDISVVGGIPAATAEEIADNEVDEDEEEEAKDIPETVEIEYQGHKVKGRERIRG